MDLKKREDPMVDAPCLPNPDTGVCYQILH